jgi:hypothetical protein
LVLLFVWEGLDKGFKLIAAACIYDYIVKQRIGNSGQSKGVNPLAIAYPLGQIKKSLYLHPVKNEII